ncbi:MAG TPA: YggS family pyridoxal phosphate-dependent enzyme [Candidatus Sutterella merdavium]|nr:YggS family pyridoxal phosphate-dependent enzyme [Candidatus Sutterella merdavium]
MQENSIETRFRALEKELAERAPQGGVALLAVSKTFGIEAVEAAWRAGARRFGENYVQEGVEKCRLFRERHPDAKVEWHFIGSLQSNKTRPVAETFDWVQTIDRVKIAERLSAQRPENLAPLNVLIEVNADGEATKSGVSWDEIEALADRIAELPKLRLRGLMAIPEANGADGGRRAFARMREAFEALKRRHPEVDTLSMGMTADWRAAVEEGSTLIRVGSGIFGARDYSRKQRKEGETT